MFKIFPSQLRGLRRNRTATSGKKSGNIGARKKRKKFLIDLETLGRSYPWEWVCRGVYGAIRTRDSSVKEGDNLTKKQSNEEKAGLGFSAIVAG